MRARHKTKIAGSVFRVDGGFGFQGLKVITI